MLKFDANANDNIDDQCEQTFTIPIYFIVKK